ncbi:MAG: protein kinase [bacterium]|nr:protein kinase [bacterium]
MIGSTISHYRILDKLGEGGMGEVYLAEDTQLERKVALKFLPPHVSRETEALKRFEREAKATAALQHPNIVTIHEFGVHEGRHFIVMAYIEGELLSDLIARKDITIDQAFAFTLDLCDALGDAHREGIIHRDLKPANVLVDRKGRAQVLDFGLALKTGATKLTQEGTTVGSLHYMSPEQSGGTVVDARTDIFSLGAILYEMVTGRLAFPGEHAAAIQYKIANEDPQPLARYNNEVTPELERIVAKALAKDREIRYQTMSGLASALRPLHAPVKQAGAKTTTLQLLRSAAVAVAAFLMRPVVISGIVLGLVGFFAGAITIGGLLDRSSTATGPVGGSPARFMIPVPPEAPVIPLPETSALAVAPNGEYVVYVGAGSPGIRARPGEGRLDRTQLYLRLIDDFTASAIDGTDGASAPFISPDSRWIGFLDNDDGKIKKVARGGGVPVEICENVETNFRGACWSGDGKIYFAETSTGIHVVSADGGERQPVAIPQREKGEKTYRFPHVLPGDRALLFTLGSSEILSYDDASVALLLLETGEIRVLVQGGTNPRYVPTGYITFGRGGKILAVPFDTKSLQVTGLPREVLDGVVTSHGYGSAHFSFSNDGTLVYVSGGPEQFASELFFLHRDGRVELIPQPVKNYGNVSISPDGDRMAVSVLGANATVWIYDLSRGTMTRLISTWDNHSPIWHPNGEIIAFGSNRSGTEAVWLTASDGSGQPTLLPGSETTQYPSSWSPDGEWITGARPVPTRGTDVWVISANGSGMSQPAIGGASQEFSPAFSPDGGWIAYNSDESGRTEVYVQAFPITGQRWKLSENGGDTPVWSRDGRELYYWGDGALMVVQIELDPEFKPSKARLLTRIGFADVHDFDVFPDGKRFVVIGRSVVSGRDRPTILRTAGGQTRIFPAMSPNLHVVTHWFSELHEP